MYMDENVTIFPLFPNLLLTKDIIAFPSIKDELIDWIYKYKNKDPLGEKRSNVGGYHSDSNIFNQKSFKKYSDIIHDEVEKCLSTILEHNQFEITEGWVNINKKGDFNRTHVHPAVDLAAVFWIQVSGEETGSIEFEHPSVFAQSNLLDKVKPELSNNYYVTKIRGIYPREGSLIIFPSNISHFVLPNHLDFDRISISFNIVI